MALLASLEVSWWHFWYHLGCFCGTFGVIGAVLGRLGRQGPPKSKIWPRKPAETWILGVVFGTKTAPNNDQKTDRTTDTNICAKHAQNTTNVYRVVLRRVVFCCLASAWVSVRWATLHHVLHLLRFLKCENHQGL